MEDLISRQTAIDAVMQHKVNVLGGRKWDEGIQFGYEAAHEHICEVLAELPPAQPEQQWIPVKYRPMDSEEREYWEDQLGLALEDGDAVMFDCKMPDDGQEILVSYRRWISMDKCEIDGGCYGLEGNGDWDGVVAWMPSPEPYKED